MKYKTVNTLEEEACRRLTGVKRATFNKMPEILREANKAKKRWQKQQALYRRYVINGAGILKGIPDIFSYRPKLWCKRKYGL